MENSKKIMNFRDLLIKSWQEYLVNFRRFLPLIIFTFILVISIFTIDFIISKSIKSLILLRIFYLFFSFFNLYLFTRLSASGLLFIRSNYNSFKDSFIESGKFFWGFIWVAFIGFILGLISIDLALIAVFIFFISNLKKLKIYLKTNYSLHRRKILLTIMYFFGIILIFFCVNVLLFFLLNNFLSIVIIPRLYSLENLWHLFDLLRHLIYIILLPFLLIFLNNIYQTIEFSKNKLSNIR